MVKKTECDKIEITQPTSKQAVPLQFRGHTKKSKKGPSQLSIADAMENNPGKWQTSIALYDHR